MSKTRKINGDQPGNQQASREIPGCDRQRRMLLGGVAGATAAPAAPDPLIPPGADPLSAEEMAWAEQFLSRNVSVDAHCHPGVFFF